MPSSYRTETEDTTRNPMIKFLNAVQNNAIMYGRSWNNMEETKLTVRIPRDLVENIKRYAAQNHTTITNLIEAYLRRIPVEESLDKAPIVRRLIGIMPPEVGIIDYKEHLKEKYDQ
jgi:hypothetical protein